MKVFFDADKLKKLLPATEVVKYYLGVPKNIIGKVFYWETPFREGAISGATLKVNKDFIIDMGGDFKGDIFAFVARLKDVKFYEAINIIAKDFNIPGLENSVGENELRVIPEKQKKEIIALEEGEKTEKIFTMLDIKDFKKKPTGKEIGEIKNRIPSLVVKPYELKSLYGEITSGHTCIPAGIVGESRKNWKQQQIFMVDIDNTIKVKGKNVKILSNDPRHVTEQKVNEYCKQIGLVPTFIYKTFSYTDECNKLRLVYVMEEPITDITVAENIYFFLKEQLQALNIDEAPTQLESIFFGGKELCDCSDIFYKPVKKEIEIEKTKYSIVYDYGDYNKYIEKMKNQGVGVQEGCLCKIEYEYDKQGKVKETATPIANFLPVITKQVTYDNGKDENTTYNLKGILLDSKKELPEITVTKEALESVSYSTNSKWNIQAVKFPIMRVEDNIRYAVQLVSKDDIECKKVYAHTGFIRIDDKLVFLAHGKVIGDVKDIDVDLSLDRLEQYCFTDKEFDLKDALKTSYSILEVADHKITIPLLATVYLSPLTSLFSENGLLADYVLWIQGKTGSRKSSLVAVSLSHYGKFNRNNFPCSFRDTANSLEKKAYILKDVCNVIDDFNPETVGTGKVGTSEKLLGMYGDRQGRDRMSRDGKNLNGAYYPRGLCIMTGESFPNVAESRLARAIIVDVKPTSIDLHKLKVLQDNTEKLSFAMQNYIIWIIENEKSIIQKAIKIQVELREKEVQGELHGRTLEAVNMIAIGFTLFLDFLYEKGVINIEQKEKQLKECMAVLGDLAEMQKEEIDVNKPTQLFAEAIKEMCATGRTQVMNFNIPCDPKLCPNLIGFYDDSEGQYYILPDIAYAEVVRFYRTQGVKFPVSKSSLQKMLADEEYLYISPKNDRKTVKRKLPTTNATVAVWAIYQDKLGLETFSERLKPLLKAENELRENLIKENSEKQITKTKCEK